jgi:sugar phosphate isomerase/epimerase
MIPTLFSVSYAGLWGQHTLGIEDFIAKAARLGYPAVALMGKRPHLSVLDSDERRLEAIREKAQQHKVEIATIAGYTDFMAGRHTPEVPLAEVQIAYVKELARLGQKLGAKNVRVFTGYTTDPQSYTRDWDTCVRCLRECAVIAEGHGLVLGVQNHHDTALSSAAYAEFLDEINHPNCRAMFDPWAPALVGEDLYHWAKLLAPRMVQTTLADYLRFDRYAYQSGLVNYQPLPAMVRAVPLGQGFIDLAVFFKGLRDGGFKGHVVYEMCSPLRGGGSEENLDRTARASLEQIRKLCR